jgi:DNA polymerase epsilon subunit 3
VQTDKRNTYRKKVAADKASGKPEDEDGDTTLEHEGEGDADGLGRDGQPAAKKARRDASQGGAGEDEGDLREGDGMGDREDEEVDEEGDADETEDEEGEHDAEERLEADDHLEEEQEAEDEALDNGEDSD